MRMSIVLEPHLIDEIERIGKTRAPCEACGIILPFVWQGKQVWEMPNRSLTPHDEFVMTGEDLALSLEDFIREYPDEATWNMIVAWHTHPGGNLGPSKADIENKPKNIPSLVVTLFEDAAAKATWF